MTDRELLELAAKAAGFDLAWSSTDGLSPRRTDTWGTWNPLTDDGDAFRLAVSLQIGVQSHQRRGGYVLADDGDGHSHAIVFAPGDDPQEFARRAVVTVAAEIGMTK